MAASSEYKKAVAKRISQLIISNFDELYDTTKNLLRDNLNLKLLGENAKKRSINDFSWEKVINNYYSIFSKILK